MNTADVRTLLLSTKLQEKRVIVPGWESTNLIIRELSGKAGAELIAQCTDADGKIVQESLVAGVILATLRNADDPNKALVFGYEDRDEANPLFKDAIMSIGLGRVMSVAKASIDLSGLNESAQVEDLKNDSERTIVEGSLTTSQVA